MLSSDLKVYKAKSNGRMDGAQLVTSGVLQNVFPHVTSSQRTAGFFDYKKTFWKVADDADGTLLDPEIYEDAPTLSATDYVTMFAMGQRDRVEDLTGYGTGTDTQRKYGSAVLKTSITAGASTLVVTVKNAALAAGSDVIFVNGDKIKLTDKASADALTGNEEVLTINGVPSVTGLDVTITVAGTIANSYTANGTTRVSSLIKPGDIAASIGTVTKTSTAGTLDTATYPVILDNIGTVDEDWTFTFTDATHFNCSGDSLGAMGSGIISANFIPNNTDFTKPYFTFDYRAFGGTWAAGNTITFTTHPAAVGIGQKRVVPAGSASLANNKTTQVLGGEAV
ncbi:MAG: hypothetical protein ACOYB1_18685 [Limnohabitans sp.]